MSYLQWWVQVRVPVSGGQLSSLQIVGGRLSWLFFALHTYGLLGVHLTLEMYEIPAIPGFSTRKHQLSTAGVCVVPVSIVELFLNRNSNHTEKTLRKKWFVSRFSMKTSFFSRTPDRDSAVAEYNKAGTNWTWMGDRLGRDPVWAQLGTTQPTHPEVTGWLDVATSFQGEGVGLTQH